MQKVVRQAYYSFHLLDWQEALSSSCAHLFTTLWFLPPDFALGISLNIVNDANFLGCFARESRKSSELWDWILQNQTFNTSTNYTFCHVICCTVQILLDLTQEQTRKYHHFTDLHLRHIPTYFQTRLTNSAFATFHCFSLLFW